MCVEINFSKVLICGQSKVEIGFAERICESKENFNYINSNLILIVLVINDYQSMINPNKIGENPISKFNRNFRKRQSAYVCLAYARVK